MRVGLTKVAMFIQIHQKEEYRVLCLLLEMHIFSYITDFPKRLSSHGLLALFIL